MNIGQSKGMPPKKVIPLLCYYINKTCEIDEKRDRRHIIKD